MSQKLPGVITLGTAMGHPSVENGIAPEHGHDAAPESDAKVEIEVLSTDTQEGGAEIVVEASQDKWIVKWWKSKISGPFMLIIRRGTEPKQLAGSASLGITLGVFPIYGVTVFLCGIALLALRSRCHAPTLMLTNFVATPLEIALLIPFLRIGEWMTNGGHIMLSSNALWQAITGHATKAILLSLLHALVGWAVAAPFLMILLYIVFLPIFTCMVRKYGAKADPELQIGLLETEEEQ